MWDWFFKWLHRNDRKTLPSVSSLDDFPVDWMQKTDITEKINSAINYKYHFSTLSVEQEEYYGLRRSDISEY